MASSNRHNLFVNFSLESGNNKKNIIADKCNETANKTHKENFKYFFSNRLFIELAVIDNARSCLRVEKLAK